MYLLKLNKHLYGVKQAAYNWFEILKDGLHVRGFENQSSSDPCRFFSKDEIVLVYYVDDCIVFSRKGSGASGKLIADLKKGNKNMTSRARSCSWTSKSTTIQELHIYIYI